jgi:hypothetical protein
MKERERRGGAGPGGKVSSILAFNISGNGSVFHHFWAPYPCRRMLGLLNKSENSTELMMTMMMAEYQASMSRQS